MKKFVVISILWMLIPWVSFAQEQPLTRPETTPPLTFTIKSDKEVYEARDAINISWELKNISQETQKVRILDNNHKYYFGISPFIKFMVTKNGVSIKTYRSIDRKEMYFGSDEAITKTFLQGESYSGEFDLTKLDWDNNPFNESGNFEVAIEYFGNRSSSNRDSKNIISNAITIEVKEKKALSKDTAKEIAEKYIVKQHYKDVYEDKAYEVVEGQDYFDVFFHRKNRLTEKLKGEGLVRVDKRTSAASLVPGM